MLIYSWDTYVPLHRGGRDRKTRGVHQRRRLHRHTSRALVTTTNRLLEKHIFYRNSLANAAMDRPPRHPGCIQAPEEPRPCPWLRAGRSHVGRAREAGPATPSIPLVVPCVTSCTVQCKRQSRGGQAGPGESLALVTPSSPRCGPSPPSSWHQLARMHDTVVLFRVIAVIPHLGCRRSTESFTLTWFTVLMCSATYSACTNVHDLTSRVASRLAGTHAPCTKRNKWHTSTNCSQCPGLQKYYDFGGRFGRLLDCMWRILSELAFS